MSWFVLLDIMVAVLLVVTIFYAILLNRRLGHLRGNRAELDRVSSGFHEAVARAEASVATLKVSTNDLQARIDQSRALQDDLEILLRRGEDVADRLEEAVRNGRKHGGEGPSRSRAAPTAARPAARAVTPPRSEAERELLKALSSERRAG